MTSKIEKHKQIFKEPRRKTDLNTVGVAMVGVANVSQKWWICTSIGGLNNNYLTQKVMESYYEAVRNPSGSGAILLAVCRGKVTHHYYNHATMLIINPAHYSVPTHYCFYYRSVKDWILLMR